MLLFDLSICTATAYLCVPPRSFRRHCNTPPQLCSGPSFRPRRAAAHTVFVVVTSALQSGSGDPQAVPATSGTWRQYRERNGCDEALDDEQGSGCLPPARHPSWMCCSRSPPACSLFGSTTTSSALYGSDGDAGSEGQQRRPFMVPRSGDVTGGASQVAEVPLPTSLEPRATTDLQRRCPGPP